MEIIKDLVLIVLLSFSWIGLYFITKYMIKFFEFVAKKIKLLFLTKKIKNEKI
jgi:hypothetical protein